MEANVHRINGIKTHLERLSDEELENHMGFAHERIERATADLEALGIESARRFAAAESLGSVISHTFQTPNVVELFPGQPSLPGFDGPQPAA